MLASVQLGRQLDDQHRTPSGLASQQSLALPEPVRPGSAPRPILGVK